MNRRGVLRSVGAVSLGGTIAGCGALNSNDGGGSGLANPMTTNFPSPSFDLIHFVQFPVLQAVLDEELDLEMDEGVFNGHVPLIGSLVNDPDDVQLASVGTEAVIDAQNQGLPVRITRPYATEFFHALIMDPDLDGMDDLEGAEIAVHAPTSTSRAMVSVIAEEEFGSVDAVDLQYIIGTANRLAALESGEVDAVIGLMPSGFQAELNGYGTVVARPWEYESLSDICVLGWMFLEYTLDEHESELHDVHDAIDEAHERLYDDDVEDVVDAALETDVYPAYDREAWIQAFELARERELWPRDRNATDAHVDGLQDVLVATGLLDEDERRSMDDVFDDRFFT